MNNSTLAVRAAARRRHASPNGGFDRAKVDGRLEALRRRLPDDDAAFRREAVDLFREVLEEGRADARFELEEGGTGRACAMRLSGLEDEIIRAIHDMAVRYIHA